MNKSDLECITSEDDIREHLDQTIIPFSAKNGNGLDVLEDLIAQRFFSGGSNGILRVGVGGAGLNQFCVHKIAKNLLYPKVVGVLLVQKEIGNLRVGQRKSRFVQHI